MSKDYKKLKKLYANDPEMLRSLEQQEHSALLKQILEETTKKSAIEIKAEMIKGDKGDTPVKGRDYFTQQEADEFLEDATPIKGHDYFTEDEIAEFKNAITPVKGIHYFDGENGTSGRNGTNGKDGTKGEDGKHGTEITPSQIADKLNTLEEMLEPKLIKGYESSDDIIKKIKSKKVKMQDIEGMPLNLMELLHGGGITNIYNGATLVTNSGTSLNFTGSGVTSVVNSNGAVTVTISGGGSTTLTHDQIAFGSPTNTITSSANFIYSVTDGSFLVASPTYPDGLITTDGPIGVVALGDSGGDVNVTYLIINDTAEYISLNATTYTITSNDYNTGLFTIDGSPTGLVTIGDFAGAVNNTYISVNDSTQNIAAKSNIYLFTTPSYTTGLFKIANTGIVSIGDLGGLNNGTTILVNDGAARISYIATTHLFSTGSIGVGLTPTAVLTLKAGTASASTAPLKFTSGTNLTAPEAGAMEWDGTRGYLTQTSGPTRQTLAYLTDITLPGVFPWTVQTGTTQTAVVNHGYITNNAGVVTVTLPTTAAVGSIIEVAGLGVGGWLIAQSSGQQIHFGNLNTTSGAGGSLASTNRYDTIRLLCVVANNEFDVLSAVGNLTIV